jgi:hypothetical protein
MVENDGIDVGHVGQAGYNHLARVQAKVAQFHTEALTRDRALCGYSKDAQFCPRPKLFPYPEQAERIGDLDKERDSFAGYEPNLCLHTRDGSNDPGYAKHA